MVPQNGWFLMENLLKWMIWGYHYLWKQPFRCSLYRDWTIDLYYENNLYVAWQHFRPQKPTKIKPCRDQSLFHRSPTLETCNMKTWRHLTHIHLYSWWLKTKPICSQKYKKLNLGWFFCSPTFPGETNHHSLENPHHPRVPCSAPLRDHDI